MRGAAVRLTHLQTRSKRAITVDTALRLALFFNMSSSFWLGLQKDYELDMVKTELTQKIQKEVHPWQQNLAIT